MIKQALPIIGITMGDPAGIGPEICVKAWEDAKVHEVCNPLVVGSAACMQYAVRQCGLSTKRVHAVHTISDCLFEPDVIDVYDLPCVADPTEQGCISAKAGEMAFQAVKTAIELALSGEIAATVTAPLNKEALRLAGHDYAGHTEIYAHYTKTPHYCMMLAYEDFRIVHVTTHVSLRKACDLITKERVLEVIELANQTCKQMGIVTPRIAISGLNPHAGENGLFGGEELNDILPAVLAAGQAGLQVEGPLPPDTVFAKGAAGYYDVVVAMYHDQGHIPMKMAGFQYHGQSNSINGVNITLGLPIIRVSVDHGTAFDIAGKNIASCASLVESILYAARLSSNSAKICHASV